MHETRYEIVTSVNLFNVRLNKRIKKNTNTFQIPQKWVVHQKCDRQSMYFHHGYEV